MSVPTTELDYSLWQAYLVECQANDLQPDLSDYKVWLAEADLDRDEAEYYED